MKRISFSAINNPATSSTATVHGTVLLTHQEAFAWASHAVKHVSSNQQHRLMQQARGLHSSCTTCSRFLIEDEADEADFEPIQHHS